ncbi:helix-turn-helix domain-containing protein [Halegenticoccus tardaugens]|uniref:helix-turn-helix domain-containing protein n=1 Tax=Halegenticoccus tardaugens TaxID=2071624 RepID=UPI0013E91C9B|nr:helix-turn-helix domain-containing protein [Halegenticoccus tardaugens]
MTTAVELSFPPEAFVLSETVAEHPDAELDVERAIANRAVLVPFIWASNVDFDAFDRSLAADSTVTVGDSVAVTGDRRLYRMESLQWGEIIRYLVSEKEATVQRARLRDGRWRLRAFFSDRQNVSGLLKFCRRRGLDLDVERVYPLEELNLHRAGFDLSEAQHEAVSLALSSGYYDIPRTTTAAELAAELGISSQALSERLRRAHRTFAEATVLR